MSEENVETARRVIEAFNRAFAEGSPGLYELLELLDPEVEWVPMSALLDGTRYHGHDGVRQWMEEMKRDWTSYEVRPERFIDVGDDRVLALGTWRAEGRGGGVLLDFNRRPGWGRTGRESSPGCRRSPIERRPSKPPSSASRDR
jgi:ketosteroid isomerase-like protein